MILYKDVLKKLKDAGYNTNRIRKEKIFQESTLTKLRNNQPVSLQTIDRICQLLHCKVEDIVESVPEDLDITERP